MDNFALFICGIVVTLVAGMGVITSEVFLGYKKFMENGRNKEEENNGTIKQVV
jgi:hypothetical protein